MSLTIGGGPLSVMPEPRDVNFTLDGPRHRLFAQPFGRRVRAQLDGATVIDSVAGVLVHESNLLPVLYVPRADVRAKLVPTDHSTHCPFKGDASYWSIGAAENVVWGYLEPIVPWLDGLVAPYFDRMDRWLDEDTEVRGHLRDPYHRVDAWPSSARVTVTIGSTTVAQTTDAVLVAETGLPNRWYVPRAAVTDTAEPTATTSHCPYKGDATYWTVGGATDVAWSYEAPLDGCQALAGHLSFDGDDVQVDVHRGQ